MMRKSASSLSRLQKQVKDWIVWNRPGHSPIDLLSKDLQMLEQRTCARVFSQASHSLLADERRLIDRMLEEAKSLGVKSSADKLLLIEELHKQYLFLEDVVNRLLEQDAAWKNRAVSLRQDRAALGEVVAAWAPAWQESLSGLFNEVDAALSLSPRTKETKEELQRAADCIARIRSSLEFVTNLDSLFSQMMDVEAVLGKMSPVSGGYLQQDIQTFKRLLERGRRSFERGDYVSAERDVLSAQSLGLQVQSEEEDERLKGWVDAEEWLALLENDGEAALFVEDIRTLLSNPSHPDFLVEWEQVHGRILEHVHKRAYRSGNRDQRDIGNQRGAEPSLKWKRQIDAKQLVGFARIVSDEL